MGRRIQALGLGLVLVPYSVDVVVDLKSASQWWNHQLYWDQNTWMARPIGFFCHVLIRLLPFALLFAAVRLFDATGLSVLAGALALRLLYTAATLSLLGERAGLASLPWLPLRDVAGLGIWLMALRKRTVVWRGVRFELTRDGRILLPPPAPAGSAARTPPEAAELTREAWHP
jgi:ceramide glucosyltransferase